MLSVFMDVLDLILKILTGYTVLLSIFCILPRKKTPVAPPQTRFAVLIPARNEEMVIGQIIKSLQQQEYPENLYDVFVLPNNCTDHTEEAALQAGAEVLHCTKPVSTKGEVLHQVFEQLMGKYDAYCVFDADNIVDRHFLARMNDVVVAGGQVAKSRQCALNPYDNWVSGCYDLYFQSHNLLHSRARAPFPLSAKLIGTGFMVTDSLMQQMGGWNTYTLTEDIELAVQCAMIGQKVHYVPEALTYDEEPLSFKVSLRQRWRWSAGVQSVANRYTLQLLKMRPVWLRWDLASHINMIYVQLLALIPIIYGFVRGPITELPQSLLISVLSFVAGGIAMGLFLSVTAKRNVLKQWKAILMYPVFLASWYVLHIRALLFRPKTWQPIAHGTLVNRQVDKEKMKQ